MGRLEPRRRLGGPLVALALASACGPPAGPGGDPGPDDDTGTQDDDSSAPDDDSAGPDDDTEPPDDDTTEPPALPAGLRVLDSVTVVDAGGARPGCAVLISGDTVFGVRDAGGPWPGDAEVLDLPGRFVVPGLVDSHVHLAHSGATIWTGDPLASNLAASLYHGVTAVLDAGGPEVLFEARDAIAAGDLLGPDVLATGPFLTAVLSHPCESHADPDLCLFVEPGTAGAAAAGLLDRGADALKVALADAAFTPWPTPRLDLDALAEVVATGAPVLAHVDADADMVDAVAAGVEVLAHPAFAGPMDAAALSAASAARGVHTTVSAFQAVVDVLAGDTDLADPHLVAGPGVIDNWVYVRAHPEVLEAGWAEASAEWAEAARENLPALRGAGATLLPGSDAGYYFVPHGMGLHRELEAMVDLGWTPLEALTAATLTAREVLGLPGGRVEAGSPADLVVLASDPVADVHALADIETVVRRGIPWERAALLTADPYAGPGAEGAICLEAADCTPGLACDAVARRCRPECAPLYAASGACDVTSWCMPTDGLSAPEGVCHEEEGCDLYAQDCAPSEYGMACAPMDADTSACIPGGPRTAGQTCSYDVPDLACEPGSFCSWVTGRCYVLCDPDAVLDPCAPGGSCVIQYAAPGVPWFGLCL
ncbi:amidohydrolase family protein [Myxococcota bacterium]|nr:amidohydrolase family protein [Myxococcota bacterium]